MLNASNNSSSFNDSSRCQHRFTNGKRCRLPASESQSGLCARHFNLSSTVGASRLPSWSDSEDLSPDLLGQPCEFGAAVDVRQFLARLLLLVTKGRVSPRRAAVLAYITNQLLHSHSAIHRENNLQSADEPQQIIFDLPRPKRD